MLIKHFWVKLLSGERGLRDPESQIFCLLSTRGSGERWACWFPTSQSDSGTWQRTSDLHASSFLAFYLCPPRWRVIKGWAKMTTKFLTKNKNNPAEIPGTLLSMRLLGMKLLWNLSWLHTTRLAAPGDGQSWTHHWLLEKCGKWLQVLCPLDHHKFLNNQGTEERWRGPGWRTCKHTTNWLTLLFRHIPSPFLYLSFIQC